jgi:hypothetical protein
VVGRLKSHETLWYQGCGRFVVGSFGLRQFIDKSHRAGFEPVAHIDSNDSHERKPSAIALVASLAVAVIASVGRPRSVEVARDQELLIPLRFHPIPRPVDGWSCHRFL